jgi:tRNA threonylcarbamoyladenosine biosynthesis protein TsaE
VRIELPTRRATSRLGGLLAGLLAPADLVVLSGDLGAGKTFLARAVIRAMGVPREVRVTSPTFTLVRQYEGRLPIVHADLYRLVEPRAVDELGLREQRAGGAIVLVEWGEPFARELGGDGLVVRLALLARGREAEIEAQGGRASELLERLRNACRAQHMAVVTCRRGCQVPR